MGDCEEVAPIMLDVSLPSEGYKAIDRYIGSRVATVIVSFTRSGTNEGNENGTKVSKRINRRRSLGKEVGGYVDSFEGKRYYTICRLYFFSSQA